MTVWELIIALRKMPKDAEVVTNCCEVTGLHEDTDNSIIVGFAKEHPACRRVYVGSQNDRLVTSI